MRCMDACMPAPSPSPALTNLSQVVISESMAQNYASGISVVESGIAQVYVMCLFEKVKTLFSANFVPQG